MLPRFEPHSHTAYSNLRLLDCINMPKNLVKYAKEIGLAGICITDHEALSCHVELSILQKEMQSNGSQINEKQIHKSSRTIEG